MNPSDIVVNTPMPLTATFGRVEAEAAAALIVATLAATDDRWRPVLFSEFRDNAAALNMLPWIANPFVKPSIDELVDRGFATISEDRTTAELNDAALEVLRGSVWNNARKRGGT